jgi:hypothetical protein
MWANAGSAVDTDATDRVTGGVGVSNVREDSIGKLVSIEDAVSIRLPASGRGATRGRDTGAGTGEEENEADGSERGVAAAWAASKSSGGIGRASGIRTGGAIVSSGGADAGIEACGAGADAGTVAWSGCANAAIGADVLASAGISGAVAGFTSGWFDGTTNSDMRTGSLTATAGGGWPAAAASGWVAGTVAPDTADAPCARPGD